MELFIPISYIPISPFISKSIITFSPSSVFIKWLYAPYKLALYIKLAILNLIFNYFSFKLAVAVYKGLSIGRPFLYILYIPYIPI